MGSAWCINSAALASFSINYITKPVYISNLYSIGGPDEAIRFCSTGTQSCFYYSQYPRTWLQCYVHIVIRTFSAWTQPLARSTT